MFSRGPLAVAARSARLGAAVAVGVAVAVAAAVGVDVAVVVAVAGEVAVAGAVDTAGSASAPWSVPWLGLAAGSSLPDTRDALVADAETIGEAIAAAAAADVVGVFWDAGTIVALGPLAPVLPAVGEPAVPVVPIAVVAGPAAAVVGAPGDAAVVGGALSAAAIGTAATGKIRLNTIARVITHDQTRDKVSLPCGYLLSIRYSCFVLVLLDRGIRVVPFVCPALLAWVALRRAAAAPRPISWCWVAGGAIPCRWLGTRTVGPENEEVLNAAV